MVARSATPEPSPRSGATEGDEPKPLISGENCAFADLGRATPAPTSARQRKQERAEGLYRICRGGALQRPLQDHTRAPPPAPSHEAVSCTGLPRGIFVLGTAGRAQPAKAVERMAREHMGGRRGLFQGPPGDEGEGLRCGFRTGRILDLEVARPFDRRGSSFPSGRVAQFYRGPSKSPSTARMSARCIVIDFCPLQREFEAKLASITVISSEDVFRRGLTPPKSCSVDPLIRKPHVLHKPRVYRVLFRNSA